MVGVQAVDDLRRTTVIDLRDMLVPAAFAKRNFFKNTPLEMSSCRADNREEQVVKSYTATVKVDVIYEDKSALARLRALS